MGKLRIGMIAGVLVTGFVISEAFWGWVFLDIFSDPYAIFVLPLVVWLAAPFIAVAAAIADGDSSRIAMAGGFAVAVAGSLLVPLAVNSAVESDPSSTASLLHLWDPLPVTLAVGAVFGLDYLAHRFANRPTKAF